MSYVLFIVKLVILANTIIAIWTVFKNPRNITTTWAWLLTLIFLPIVGFFLYAFLGRGMDRKSRQVIQSAKLSMRQKKILI